MARGHREHGGRGLENRFRIIGGRWRGRRLAFPPRPGIRPSPDRVRETLFNWLSPIIEGAACLDLFAGSGALGLEACSRGAGTVVLVERDPEAASALEHHRAALGCTTATVVCADAEDYLAGPGPAFDVAFLDPPFRQGLLPRLCSLLAGSGRLLPQARIYLECEAEADPPQLPPGWVMLRSGRAGRVRYHLAQAG